MGIINCFLNFASQLGKILGINNEKNCDKFAGNSSQEYAEYANFILDLLQAETESKSDDTVIYLMLSQRQHLLNDRFAKIFQQEYENFITENPEPIRLIVLAFEYLSVHISEFHLGNTANNIEIGIIGCQTVLKSRKPGSNEWAMTQTNLGNAYCKRIQGEKAKNIEMAIDSYTAALSVYTLEDFSRYWAGVQMNLGNAYRNRIMGKKAENIEIAIACYTAVLSVYTREAFPEDWAMTQSNLAITYCKRIKGEKAENIEMAIVSCTVALEVFTHTSFPKQWSGVQMNLGNAYRNRIKGKKAKNIEMAIACYTAVLSVITREAFPKDWAMTQSNLAAAYCGRIIGKKAENIEIAITCYTAVLSVYTREAFPEDWAMTQSNLAGVYLSRINGEKAQNIEMAIASCTVALKVYTRDAFPEDWAMTQNKLGIAYRDRIREEKPKNIKKAIKLFHDALAICTREAFPQYHTGILLNLGNLHLSNQHWQLAYNTFYPAIETVEFLRGDILSGDESKQKLAEEWSLLYLNIVVVCLELQNYTGAIEYVERSKARNLAEQLANKDIYPRSEFYPNSEDYQTHCHQLDRLRRQIPAKQRELEILINSQQSEDANRNRIKVLRFELNQ
jgi:tetratricopeptide (TPR) repeat protein